MNVATLIVLASVMHAGPGRRLGGPDPHVHAASGRVMRVVGRDTLPAAGATVLLHRVTVTRSGPIDSTISGSGGRFAFHLTPDSGAVYLVSARWSGVEYFAAPLDVWGPGDDSGIVVVVADTSSTAPVRLAARHLIIAPPDSDGVRDVVDLMVIDNPGSITRVRADTVQGTWSARLPSFAVDVHGGNSDFALDAFVPRSGGWTLLAAIPPGQHDIEFDYQIPPNSRRFVVAVDHDAPVSNIISADRTMRVDGAFIRSDTSIDNKPYARWRGRLIAGQAVTLEFGTGPVPPWLLPTMLGLMAVVLITGTTLAVRRRASSPH